MIKIGDMVEVVEGGAYHTRGEKFTVAHITDECFLDGESRAIMRHKVRLIRPAKTEAEKRGAKFGVSGVIKKTGRKCVFVGESSVIPDWWEILVEGEEKNWHRPATAIRLDHEPEYREIPFSEATYEQRMDVSNLIHGGGAIVKEIYCFQNGGYAYTTSWAKTPSTALFRLTVRIPS